jgi:hypothetical protein
MSKAPTSVRLPAPLLERVAALAKEQGIQFSAAMRSAIRRGVAAMEYEMSPPTPPTPATPKSTRQNAAQENTNAR